MVAMDTAEMEALLHLLRDSHAVHAYMLLRTQADFLSGHILTTYARLIELMTPPAPEKGRRREGPTYKQLRRVLDDLEAVGLLSRDAERNAAQGQLRAILPHVQAKASEWAKRHAQQQSGQGLGQGFTAASA
jgi:hypothetical protein